jgi:hypothetical protein
LTHCQNRTISFVAEAEDVLHLAVNECRISGELFLPAVVEKSAGLHLPALCE